MDDNLRGMNERIRSLRRQSEETEPRISLERARLVTEAYREHDGKVSVPVMRSLAFANIMKKKHVCINEGELIVGERGEGPQMAPTYPELCCHTLQDMEIMHRRDKISFKVSDADMAVQASEIIPYWQGRSIRDHMFSLMTREWIDCYEAGIFTEFMEQRAPGHTVADDKIYRTGFLELIARIGERINGLDFFNDPAAADKHEQLKAMGIAAEAIITLARRYAAKARELAETESDPTRRQELLDIAETCQHVPAHTPRTFREALQAYWFVHLGVITELNTWDAFNPGRLDQHLYPFYAREVAAGSLDREQARELLQCFWVKFNNQPAPPKVGITLQESGTYTDFANINVGGLTPEGDDGVNDVSYLLLEVIGDMRLLQPSSNIQVSKKNPDHFIHEAGEVIRQGWGQPSVFNADAVVEELLRQGKSLRDARMGGTSGCVETGAFGKEAYILTGYFNLVKVLEITLHNGLDPRSGKQIGLTTGDPRGFSAMDDLLAAFRRQLEHFINIKVRGSNVIENLYATRMPAPFLSLVIDDCLEKATDYNAGGARYNTNYIQGVGIGSITDMLSAIKTHVFDAKHLNMDQLLAALKADFSGSEPLRQMLQNKTPRYGNDDDRADDLMRQVFEQFYRAVDGRPSPRGATYRINMLPTTCHVYFGSVVGATPDGRQAGKPLSEGISPVQGSDRFGPTAVIKSAAKMDHLRTGGTLLNQKFSPDVLKGEKGLTILTGLIRSYFRMDGHHIQFNVVDAETLRKAQADPAAYKNLIVRVAGYSDYFNNLNRGLQDEIIARTEHHTV